MVKKDESDKNNEAPEIEEEDNNEDRNNRDLKYTIL